MSIDIIQIFFKGYIPSWNVIIVSVLLGLAWSYVCLYFAGYLKKEKNFRTGHTRKIFHILMFLSAAVIQSAWGLFNVYIFGIMIFLVVLYSIFKGKENILYEALAREKDAPNRTYYIIMPGILTFIGGIASMSLFGEIAIVGYLVCGLGDAMGEIVGTKFGKHKYHVNWFGQISERSYEGSVAVFIACIFAITLGVILTPSLSLNIYSFITIPIIAFASTLLEAFSPHGWDNAIMQIAPAFLATFI